MEMYVDLNALQNVLEDPELYRVNADFTEIEEATPERVAITLYNEIGFQLYSTNPIKQPLMTFLPRKQLYEGLYEEQKKFGTIQYKEPVFKGGKVIGVYVVEWARDEWITGVQERSWLIISLFALFFILVFTIVAYLVNRKLNKPLHQLTTQMDAFAKGLDVEPMKESRDELGELARSFEAMREELTEATKQLADEQEQKEFMIASISHDLKTPLTSIRAYAEALESREISMDQQREYREVIIEKSRFMRQMLDDLLMYTLLQSNAYEMAFVEVDGAEFFDMLVSDYDTLCEEKGIIFHEKASVSGQYQVNAKEMIRVVDNLMSNAITHTRSGQEIWLGAVNVNRLPIWCFDFVKEALTEEEGMYLLVQNEGKGLSSAQIAKIFDPLYQADAARTKVGDGGTGLGLSITKQIIERHGGTVRMLSKENVGTAMICYLPKFKGDE